MTYRWAASCDDCPSFNLNPVTGEISAAQTYDREVKAEYLLIVVAEDGAPSAIRTDGNPNSGGGLD